MHISSHTGTLPEPLVSEVFFVYRQVFGKEPDEKVLRRLQEAKDLYTCIARDPEAGAVGFKIGYRLDQHTFYSWLGGVLSAYRNRGIAGALMEHQHAWCKKQGYDFIETKTLNRFRAMLILNLRHGFDVVSTYTDDAGEVKIVLRKGV